MIIEPTTYGLRPDDVRAILGHLEAGRIGIVPTDSVFAFCGRADRKDAYAAICRIKHLDPRDAMMSLVCRDFSQASDWFAQWDTSTFRILNRNLPGPFTFILRAGLRIPGHLANRAGTLGLRIPDHPVLKALQQELDTPLIVSSVRSDDDIVEYFTDMYELISTFEKQVAFIVSDTEMVQEASTVIDLTGEEPVVLRQSGFAPRL